MLFGDIRSDGHRIRSVGRSRRLDAKNQVMLSAIPTPTLHRTETKKSEADQAEGGGFGDGGSIEG